MQFTDEIVFSFVVLNVAGVTDSQSRLLIFCTLFLSCRKRKEIFTIFVYRRKRKGTFTLFFYRGKRNGIFTLLFYCIKRKGIFNFLFTVENVREFLTLFHLKL